MPPSTLRRLLIRVAVAVFVVVVVITLVFVGSVFGPPLFSGGLFLAWPHRNASVARDLPPSYKPLHQGHVDLATGLYIREDEDLVLTHTPAFVWRRAYLSGDHVSRQFGIGATHNAEWYLIGDGTRFQWAELIREDGSRIHFDRLTPGTSYLNAVYGHVSSPTWFYGSLVGWTGLEWALRPRDGSVLLFQDCGPSNDVCSLLKIRDTNGHTIVFNRDRRGAVRTIDNGRQHISFEYDAQHRITRAFDDSTHTVEYAYDSGGRLVRAESADAIRSYTYDSANHLLSIREPNRFIENVYDRAGRLIHQTVHRPNTPDYTEMFSYIVDGGSVVEAKVTEDDGSHTRYRFDERHNITLESYEASEGPSAIVSFDRAAGGFVRGLTVRCTKNGKRVTETVEVRPGDEERVKGELIQTKCDRH